MQLNDPRHDANAIGLSFGKQNVQNSIPLSEMRVIARSEGLILTSIEISCDIIVDVSKISGDLAYSVKVVTSALYYLIFDSSDRTCLKFCGTETGTIYYVYVERLLQDYVFSK